MMNLQNDIIIWMDDAIIKKLHVFFSTYPTHTFNKGDILISAGENPTGIFYIESGIVRNYWISKAGNEITLNMYKPHAFLPMSWAVADIQNNRFFEAVGVVHTRHAPKEDVLRFIKQNPEIMFDLLKRIYIGLEGLWLHMESLTTENASTKLLVSLIILAKRFGKKEKKNTIVQLKMSETDIANYAGISRETTSRELQKLKKKQLVHFDKQIITIFDLKKLEELLPI